MQHSRSERQPLQWKTDSEYFFGMVYPLLKLLVHCFVNNNNFKGDFYGAHVPDKEAAQGTLQ